MKTTTKNDYRGPGVMTSDIAFGNVSERYNPQNGRYELVDQTGRTAGEVSLDERRIRDALNWKGLRF